MIDRFLHRLEAWVRHPGEQVTRWRRMVVGAGRLLVVVARQLGRDRCLQQSAALAYKTILSLLPLLLISLLLFRSVGGLKDVGGKVQEMLFRALNVDGLVIAAEEAGVRRPISLADEINRRLESAYRNLNVGAVGVVGVLFLALAATSLLRQMDEALNQVWRAPARRNLWVRLTTYWTVVTVGPLLLGASIYLAGRVRGELGAVALFTTAERVAIWVLPVVSAWLVIFLAYTLMPNTAVHRRAAAVGALAAALLIEGAKRAFSWYLHELVPYSKTYGALALLPVFLVWLNLLWVLFLFGAELARGLQELWVGGMALAVEPTAGGAGAGRTALALLCLVGERFQRGKPPLDVSRLARRTGADGQEAAALARLLADAGFLVRLAGRRERYQLARAPEAIRIAEVLEALEGRLERPTSPSAVGRFEGLSRLYARLADATHSALADTTLADLLEEGKRA